MATNSILPAAWQVPQRFRDRLGTHAGRQRAMEHQGHLLLVLHTPPAPDDATRSGRFFWREPDGQWHSSDLGSGLGSLEKHLSQYAEQINRFEQEEENADGAEDYFRVLLGVAPLLRASRHLHETLQQARTMIPHDRDIINLRDRAGELERSAELLYADAKNGLDYAQARRAEEQSEAALSMSVAAHRLNLLVAFFFPIATLATLFGTNLVHGFETRDAPLPFLILVTLGLTCGVILTRFVTIRRR